MENENLRQRSQKKHLQVTLPDGKVICHKSVIMTFVEALAALDSSLYDSVQLESCHMPIFSKEIYPRLKTWMKPVKDGWYVNTQGDTGQKYLQLKSIAKQLNVNMEVEVGTDFITSDVKIVQKTSKRDKKLLVKFPDGEYIGGENPIDTLLQTVWKIGVEELRRKGLEFKGKPLITLTKQFNGQVQVDVNRWLTIPPLTKEKYMMLRVIDSMMRLNLEISII